MAILTQTLLTLVGGHFMALTLLSAWHKLLLGIDDGLKHSCLISVPLKHILA